MVGLYMTEWNEVKKNKILIKCELAIPLECLQTGWWKILSFNQFQSRLMNISTTWLPWDLLETKQQARATQTRQLYNTLFGRDCANKILYQYNTPQRVITSIRIHSLTMARVLDLRHHRHMHREPGRARARDVRSDLHMTWLTTSYLNVV